MKANSQKCTIKQRVIMSVSGLEKQGKTHFALTASAPICLLDFDIGCEGIIQKFMNEKTIYLPRDENSEQATFQMPIIPGQPIDIGKASNLWNKFVRLYQNALKSKDIMSIVIDTATDAWELLRLAKFGKLEQVMPHRYGEVNTIYSDLIRMSYGFGKNLILLHKMKPQYINDKRTAKYERAGFNSTGFLVQCNIELFRDEDGFNASVLDCRQNPDLAGETFTGEMCSFPFIAAMIFQGTTPEDWQ